MKNFILIALLCGFLSACGIKPGSVEPPEGANSHFPRTYPNTQTDPHPSQNRTLTGY